MQARGLFLVPLLLAVLELLHPTWNNNSVSDGVRAAGQWWLALHVLLLLGYAALAAMLWRLSASRIAHAVLLLFAACNTAYLAIDGIVVGILAQSNPAAADALWSAGWVNLLADTTGAAWAASLLLIALNLRFGDLPAVAPGACAILVAFAASALPAVAAPALVLSRALAAATGFWTVYQRGGASVPVALLLFAAVLRQHVGAEAAFGLVLVAIATERSAPAAAFQP